MNYEDTADVLTQRIVAIGPDILNIDDPWQLFKVSGFDCSDLNPSLAQASFALAKAQTILAASRLPVAPPQEK